MVSCVAAATHHHRRNQAHFAAVMPEGAVAAVAPREQFACSVCHVQPHKYRCRCRYMDVDKVTNQATALLRRENSTTVYTLYICIIYIYIYCLIGVSILLHHAVFPGHVSNVKAAIFMHCRMSLCWVLVVHLELFAVNPQ